MIVERAHFWDLLPINGVTFGKVGLPNVSQMAGGDVFAVRNRRLRLSAMVSVPDSSVADADALRAIAADIHQMGKVFVAGVPHRAERPDLSANIVGVDGDKIRLSGLPVGFDLGAGDWFSYATPSGGRMIHRLTQSGVVNVHGFSGWLSFEPEPAPIDFAGLVAELGAPEFHARILPGSLDEGANVPGGGAGLRFKLVQVLK